MELENMILPVIMAGGSGTRLWPLSRKAYPKQFLKLTGQHTLLQQTLLRLKPEFRSHAIVIANAEHRFLVAEQLLEIGCSEAKILLEPEGKNTAPAITLAALFANKLHNNSTLVVLSADHHISQAEALNSDIESAIKLAEEGALVTFGITPTKPETGYGYIKKGEPTLDEGFQVESFKEKPDLDTAIEYLESKDFLWNSGMFVFQADTYLEEINLFSPDILNCCKKSIDNGVEDLDFFRVDSVSFKACPSDSVDYAIMEHTDKAVVIPATFSWSDVGGYEALWDLTDKDSNGNAFSGDVIFEQSKNNYVFSESKLVATIGVEDLVIAETNDAILVASKQKSSELKKLVDVLKSKERDEVNQHRKVYRPWGNYDSVDSGLRFQVKRITVKPGEKLSVQMHHHRAEHWVVVSGTAKVRNGEKELLLTENQSTYIPIGEIHSLENPGKVPLELIEVQSGSYLGEDDIIRFEDKYGR